jgi:hypothetical protein
MTTCRSGFSAAIGAGGNKLPVRLDEAAHPIHVQGGQRGNFPLGENRGWSQDALCCGCEAICDGLARCYAVAKVSSTDWPVIFQQLCSKSSPGFWVDLKVVIIDLDVGLCQFTVPMFEKQPVSGLAAFCFRGN